MSKPQSEAHARGGDELIADAIHIRRATFRAAPAIAERSARRRRDERPVPIVQRHVLAQPGHLGRALGSRLSELQTGLRELSR
jgi:hypothetical protein